MQSVFTNSVSLQHPCSLIYSYHTGSHGLSSIQCRIPSCCMVSVRGGFLFLFLFPPWIWPGWIAAAHPPRPGMQGKKQEHQEQGLKRLKAQCVPHHLSNEPLLENPCPHPAGQGLVSWPSPQIFLLVFSVMAWCSVVVILGNEAPEAASLLL